MWPTCTTFTFSRPKMLLQAHMAFSYRFFERETHNNMVSGSKAAAKTVLGLVVWRVLLSFVLFVSMAPNWKAPISWKLIVVWLPIIPARNAQKGKQEFWIGQFLVGWYNLQVKPNIIFITYVYYYYRLPGFFANIRRCVYTYILDPAVLFRWSPPVMCQCGETTVCSIHDRSLSSSAYIITRIIIFMHMRRLMIKLLAVIIYFTPHWKI